MRAGYIALTTINNNRYSLFSSKNILIIPLAKDDDRTSADHSTVELAHVEQLKREKRHDELLSALARIEPQSPRQQHRFLGYSIGALRDLGRTEEAIAQAERGLTEFPGDPLFDNLLVQLHSINARALLKDGDGSGVLDVLREIDQLGISDPAKLADVAWLRLQALQKLGRREEAAEHARDAAQTFMDDQRFTKVLVDLKLEQAYSLEKSGQAREALAILADVEIPTEAQGKKSEQIKIRALRQLNDIDAALSQAQQSATNFPGDPFFTTVLDQLIVEKSAALVESKQFQAAHALVEPKITAGIQSANVHWLYIKSLEGLDRKSDALAHAKRAISEEIEDRRFPEYVCQDKIDRATSLLQNGNPTDALAQAVRADAANARQQSIRLGLFVDILNGDQSEIITAEMLWNEISSATIHVPQHGILLEQAVQIWLKDFSNGRSGADTLSELAGLALSIPSQCWSASPMQLLVEGFSRCGSAEQLEDLMLRYPTHAGGTLLLGLVQLEAGQQTQAAGLCQQAIDLGLAGKLLPIAETEVIAAKLHALDEHRAQTGTAIVLLEDGANPDLLGLVAGQADRSVLIVNDASDNSHLQRQYVDTLDIVTTKSLLSRNTETASHLEQFVFRRATDALQHHPGLRNLLQQESGYTRTLVTALKERVQHRFDLFAAALMALSENKSQKLFVILNDGSKLGPALDKLKDLFDELDIRISCGSSETSVRARFAKAVSEDDPLTALAAYGKAAPRAVRRNAASSRIIEEYFPFLHQPADKHNLPKRCIVCLRPQDLTPDIMPMLATLSERWSPVILLMIEDDISHQQDAITSPFREVLNVLADNITVRAMVLPRNSNKRLEDNTGAGSIVESIEPGQKMEPGFHLDQRKLDLILEREHADFLSILSTLEEAVPVIDSVLQAWTPEFILCVTEHSGLLARTFQISACRAGIPVAALASQSESQQAIDDFEFADRFPRPGSQNDCLALQSGLAKLGQRNEAHADVPNTKLWFVQGTPYDHRDPVQHWANDLTGHVCFVFHTEQDQTEAKILGFESHHVVGDLIATNSDDEELAFAVSDKFFRDTADAFDPITFHGIDLRYCIRNLLGSRPEYLVRTARAIELLRQQKYDHIVFWFNRFHIENLSILREAEAIGAGRASSSLLRISNGSMAICPDLLDAKDFDELSEGVLKQIEEDEDVMTGFLEKLTPLSRGGIQVLAASQSSNYVTDLTNTIRILKETALQWRVVAFSPTVRDHVATEIPSPDDRIVHLPIPRVSRHSVDAAQLTAAVRQIFVRIGELAQRTIDTPASSALGTKTLEYFWRSSLTSTSVNAAVDFCLCVERLAILANHDRPDAIYTYPAKTFLDPAPNLLMRQRGGTAGSSIFLSITANYRNLSYPQFDLLTVLGSDQSEALRSRGYPGDQIVEVGAPLVDSAFAAWTEASARDYVQARLDGDLTGRSLIVVATSGLRPVDEIEWLDWLASETSRHTGVSLVVKLHPYTDKTRYQQLVATLPAGSITLAQDGDIHAFLVASEVVVTDVSHAGKLAVYAGKKLWVANTRETPYPYNRFDEAGVARLARTRDDFADLVAEAAGLRPMDRDPRLLEEFIKREFTSNDGGARDRMKAFFYRLAGLPQP